MAGELDLEAMAAEYAAARGESAAPGDVWDEVAALARGPSASSVGRPEGATVPDWAPPGTLASEEVVEFGGVRVRLKVDWAVGIGGATWTSGQQLCRHLATYERRYSALRRGAPLKFLELGAGTGVSGLFAAKLFPGASVVLTDLADHLDLLDANVYLNGVEGRVVSELLDWRDADTFGRLDEAPDVVLAADCAYHESLHAPLISVLERACRSPRTTCVLGVTKSDTGLAFFDALHAAGLDYHLLEPPADAYSALFAVSRTPAFGAARDPARPPWPTAA